MSVPHRPGTGRPQSADLDMGGSEVVRAGEEAGWSEEAPGSFEASATPGAEETPLLLPSPCGSMAGAKSLWVSEEQQRGCGGEEAELLSFSSVHRMSG